MYSIYINNDVKKVLENKIMVKHKIFKVGCDENIMDILKKLENFVLWVDSFKVKEDMYYKIYINENDFFNYYKEMIKDVDNLKSIDFKMFSLLEEVNSWNSGIMVESSLLRPDNFLKIPDKYINIEKVDNYKFKDELEYIIKYEIYKNLKVERVFIRDNYFYIIKNFSWISLFVDLGVDFFIS